MNAKAKVRINANKAVARHNHRLLPGHGIEVAALNAMNDARIHEAPVSKLAMLKGIGMLVAAPFIGLAYAVALPFAGIYLLAKLALEALADRAPKALHMAKNIVLFLAAPFIALGYIIALPMVGFFMIARLALEAHAKREGAAS